MYIVFDSFCFCFELLKVIAFYLNCICDWFSTIHKKILLIYLRVCFILLQFKICICI